MPGTFIRDFGMDTITLAGPLAAKLRCTSNFRFKILLLYMSSSLISPRSKTLAPKMLTCE